MMSVVPYELVDIGANLGHPTYKEDLEEVLERAKKAGKHQLSFAHPKNIGKFNI